jgi:hypothetical protein
MALLARCMNCFTLFSLLWVISSCTRHDINRTLGGIFNGEELSTQEIASGLREALIQGISKGTDVVSRVNGYYNNPQIRIPFPPDAARVETTLRDIGMGNEVDRFIQALNRGAENAAKDARPIFVNAIKQMSIDDARAILRGQNDAATQYLRRTTSDQLRNRFRPVIKEALTQVNATKYYGDLVNTYNRVPGVTRVSPDLEAYATEKALDGLFFMIAREEANIRENPKARTTDLLKRVFGQQ